jgi:hypothetical protein
MKPYEIDQIAIEREARKLRAAAMRDALSRLVTRLRRLIPGSNGQTAH